jgi:xylan 1,4-beta-xylosidase
MRSRKPEGPYSEPWTIDVDSIDPSHFVDGDGSHYMVISPGVNIVPLSPDCSRAVGEPECVWPGTGEKAPEGPHIFRKDGWYYAMLAEGGTGYGHRITCARSRSLRGPYVPSPHNPLLMQTDPSSPIQRTGHGKLVQTSRGDWWILYLCGRPNGGEYTTLGRETALEPVRWTEDGWFVINEGAGPSLRNTAPDLPEDRPAAGDGRLAPWRDDFDSSLLSPDWEFARNPDPSSWSLTERPGFYRIWTRDPGPDSIGAKNILLRRETSHYYEARTSLEFEPSAEGEEAGLICYYGIRNHVKLSVVRAHSGARALRLAENRNGSVTAIGELRDIPRGPVCLCVRVEGQRRSFFAGDRFLGVVEDASFLSDEGVLVGKHHTGTLVGLFAHAGLSGRRAAADFDYFDYLPSPGRA